MVKRCVCVLHVWMQWLMTRRGSAPNDDGAEVSKSTVDSHLRYILTAGVAVLFLLWVWDVREISFDGREISLVSHNNEYILILSYRHGEPQNRLYFRWTF